MKVVMVNVGTMVGMSTEIIDGQRRGKVDICFVQKVWYRGNGCRVFGDEERKV